MKKGMLLTCSIIYVVKMQCWNDNFHVQINFLKIVGHSENGTQKPHSRFITEMAKRLSSHTSL